MKIADFKDFSKHDLIELIKMYSERDLGKNIEIIENA